MKKLTKKLFRTNKSLNKNIPEHYKYNYKIITTSLFYLLINLINSNYYVNGFELFQKNNDSS